MFYFLIVPHSHSSHSICMFTVAWTFTDFNGFSFQCVCRSHIVLFLSRTFLKFSVSPLPTSCLFPHWFYFYLCSRALNISLCGGDSQPCAVWLKPSLAVPFSNSNNHRMMLRVKMLLSWNWVTAETECVSGDDSCSQLLRPQTQTSSSWNYSTDECLCTVRVGSLWTVRVKYSIVFINILNKPSFW